MVGTILGVHAIQPEILVPTCVLLGFSLGSFASVVMHRIPRGESLLRPGSHCTNCNHELGWHELIPVLSYLLQAGRCRVCKTPISPRYLALEVGCGLGMGFCAAFGGLMGSASAVTLFLVVIFVISGGNSTRGQRGVTLVEALVAMALVSVLFAIFADGLRVPRQAELMALRASVAQHLTRERLEQIKAIVWADGVDSISSESSEEFVGGDTYTVTTIVEPYPISAPNALLRHVKVEVKMETPPASPEEVVESRISLVIRGRLDNEWVP